MSSHIGFAKQAGHFKAVRHGGQIFLEAADGGFAQLAGYATGKRISRRGALYGKERILEHLHVPGSKRGKGLGSRLLKVITNHADRRGQTIRLTPSAQLGGEFGGSSKALSTAQLEAWYARHGFKHEPGPGGWTSMTRRPRV